MSRDPRSASTQLLDLVCVAVLGLLLAFLAGAVARATPAAALGQEAGHGGHRSIHPIHPAGTSAEDCASAAPVDAPTVAGGPSMRGGLPASMSLAPCADGSTPGSTPTTATSAPAPVEAHGAASSAAAPTTSAPAPAPAAPATAPHP